MTPTVTPPALAEAAIDRLSQGGGQNALIDGHTHTVNSEIESVLDRTVWKHVANFVERHNHGRLPYLRGWRGSRRLLSSPH